MRNNDFKDLITSIEQARKIHSGELKSSRIFKFHPIVVKRVRQKLHASQSVFAHMIGVSIDTLQNWEQGRRKPVGPALALLKVAAAHPETVMQALQA